VQKFLTIRPGVLFPRMRDFAHQNVLVFVLFFVLFFFLGGGPATRYSQGPWADFDEQYAQGCAFWGREHKILYLDPHFPELAPFWGPFLTGQNFRL